MYTKRKQCICIYSPSGRCVSALKSGAIRSVMLGAALTKRESYIYMYTYIYIYIYIYIYREK